MNFLTRFAALTLLLTLGTATVDADPATPPSMLQLSSGERQVVLLELYTSEGCSSCPPADRWISHLTDDPRLWRKVVPLSFHVDYWDWIGWSDRFADPDYSERQRQHVREGNARVVYTPGFFANGKEWRGFFDGDPLEVRTPRAGDLSLMVSDRDVNVRFSPLMAVTDDAQVYVALLGMDLQTQVGAGENHGKTLQHDFVVLSLKRRKMQHDAGTLQAELRLPRDRKNATAIAAWVATDDSQRPLQAVGGYLP